MRGLPLWGSLVDRMLRHICRRLPPVWATSLVLAGCLGFLVDVFTSWSLFALNADTSVSILVTPVVYIAMGAAALSGAHVLG